jgi:hypothetical protein
VLARQIRPLRPGTVLSSLNRARFICPSFKKAGL